jgi:hypothetical protein
MQIETKKAIAQSIAKHLVKTLGEDVTDMAIEDAVFSELAGLDMDEQISIEKFIRAYAEVASVFINIETFRVDDEGNVRSNDDIEMEFEPVIPES